ncbi:unnamed protein product [Sympodiomycopsis kandeliae]
MPLTRARQHTNLASIDNEHGRYTTANDDDVIATKQVSTRSSAGKPKSRPSLGIRVPSSLSSSGQANIPRTVSSPALFDSQNCARPQVISESSNSASKPPPSASSSGSGSKPSRLSSASRPSTEMRSARQRAGSAHRQKSSPEDEDSSDDEGRPFSRRIGGCSSAVEVLDKRDDSNKENVAPLRHVHQDVLASEARDVDTENIARRTRGRSSLTPRRSSSSASSITSSTASGLRSTVTGGIPRSNTSASMVTRTSAALLRSSPRRVSRASTGVTASSPSTPSSRKRRADMLDAVNDTNDSDLRLPNTPMRRLRLDSVASGPSDDAESYFSSQPSSACSSALGSIFDSHSLHSAGASSYSRHTTPAISEDLDTTLRDSDGKVSSSPGLVTPPPSSGYSNVYAHARALFRYSAGTSVDDAQTDASTHAESSDMNEPTVGVKVVGRDQERRALHAFMSKQMGVFASEAHGDLEDILDGNCDSGSLYICGLPGTGKTALVRSVLSDVLATAHVNIKAPRIAFVNCMTVEQPRQIFAKALQALGEEIRGASELHMEMEAERRMEAIVKQDDCKTLIVLDEIDHLLRSRTHQNMLYRIFSWASAGTSCTLVGIANSLDLTERFVPLLASKGAAPALLHFRPFESKEIVDVLKNRLTGLKSRYDGEDEDTALNTSVMPAGACPLFVPAALELAAKKIAAATGDLRKALDAARLAIELVEGEQRKQVLVNCTATGTGTNTEASKLLSHLTPSSAPKVTPQHVLKVITAVLGSPHLTKLRQLGLQPKLLLSATVIACKRAAENMPVLGTAGSKKLSTSVGQTTVRVCDVESTYNAMLENDGGFSPLESSEVLEILHVLEVQGIIALDSEVEGQGSSGASLVRDSTTSAILYSPRSGVSPGGKRAARKQLLACNRLVHLKLPMDDISKGITTVMSAFGGSESNTEAGAPSQAVCTAIKRMMNFEEERIRRGRGWEAIAREREEVRREELGGGRMAVLT